MAVHSGIPYLIIFTISHLVSLKTLKTVFRLKQVFTHAILTIYIAIFFIKNI